MYKLLVIPIVAGMKMSNDFSKFVSKVTKAGWLNEAIKPLDSNLIESVSGGKSRITLKDIIQIKNPRTGRYTKIDRSSGVILSQKRTDRPYKNIPIVKRAVK
jgi:hypothetical protein